MSHATSHTLPILRPHSSDTKRRVNPYHCGRTMVPLRSHYPSHHGTTEGDEGGDYPPPPLFCLFYILLILLKEKGRGGLLRGRGRQAMGGTKGGMKVSLS